MSSFKDSLLNSASNSIGMPRKHDKVSQLRELPIQPTHATKIPLVESLEKGKRGLVLFPPCSVSDDGAVFSNDGDMSPVTLRKSVLFWDKLEIPSNNIVEIGFNTTDVEYLQSCGVVQRTRVEMFGSFDLMQALVNSHKTVFAALDEATPRAWSTASEDNNVVFTNDEMEDTSGVMVKLYDALLVPDGNIPLEDVLEFRERRRDELLALRHHLDDVYLKIITSPDSALVELSEIERLDLAIANYSKAIKEKKFSLTSTTLQANFSLTKAGVAALTASSIAGPLGLPLSSVAIAGIAAGIDIRLGKGLKGNRSKDTPFQYINSLHREF